ncbi:MAG: type II toxin-antitoxin system PemK/MazF family toxin [Deltaproteobacteria bacterium]|nr:type II toxin-antitoxin system PemK/MazF family toxin [Deltaproteobacteria bacterium]MBW2663403.1 type II toxin-antitoxin system PemK/MazF family toxin [Deltaproteobacteria bacterium]
MARILRGDIIWADLNPTIGHEQSGKRPVLILSHEVFNKRSGTVIVVAITSQPQKAGFPLTLELQESNLPKRSWAKISQIRTLSVKRLRKKIGIAKPEEINLIIEGLNEIIGG